MKFKASSVSSEVETSVYIRSTELNFCLTYANVLYMQMKLSFKRFYFCDCSDVDTVHEGMSRFSR